MSDVSRSCARCSGVATVARGNASYCAECIELMDWAEVIAVVQDTVEPEPAGVAAAPATTGMASTETATSTSSSPIHPDDADPFARRLI